MLAWNWSPATSSARASSSAANPVALSVFRAASSRSSATQGERDGADPRRERLARDRDRRAPLHGALEPSRHVRPLDGRAPGDDPVGPADRVLEERGRPELDVDDAQLERLGGLERPVVLQRVLEHDLERVLDADEVRQQPRASPGRDDAEEHLGQREGRRGRVDRAVVGVQGDLEPAAEGEAVDEDEGGHARLVQLAEGRVPQSGELARHVTAGDLADLAEVGPRGEEVRLAGHGDRLDLSPGGAGPEAVEGRAELRQGRGAERARSLVVAPVVEGDEAEHPARGQGDVAHVRVRHHLVGAEGGELVDCGAHDRAAFRE
jgi:hypothetical protein